MNKVAGYRKMLNLTQKQIAKKFNISTQAYWQKEKGLTPFTDEEKLKFKEMLVPFFPEITIDAIFFASDTKKLKGVD